MAEFKMAATEKKIFHEGIVDMGIESNFVSNNGSTWG